MSSLHGSWIAEQDQQYFFIWGETWRNLPKEKDLDTNNKTPHHPFCLEKKGLNQLLESHKLNLEHFVDFEAFNGKTQWQSLVWLFPSMVKTKGKTAFPVLSEDLVNQTKLTLNPWEIKGYRLRIAEAVRLLQILPLGNTETFLSGDLRFWSQVYRWSLDLIARGKFLPGIVENGQQEVRSCWQPLLDSSLDQARLAKLLQFMPIACRAYQLDSSSNQEEGEFVEPEKLLLSFLQAIIDSQLREWTNFNFVSSKESLVQPWLSSLESDDVTLTIEPMSCQRLETALDNWTLPIQEYVVNPKDYSLAQNLFRNCFRLVPPTTGEINWGYTDWKLQYHLQALDDPDVMIDAATIWQYPVEELEIEGRTLAQPQETLLKGLGLASRLYSVIADSLQEKKPTQCKLNPIQVYEFIRAIAWQLEDNGLGVILPPGLAAGTGEKRLGIKITAQVDQSQGQRLSLQNLLKYKLDVAIGDKTISQADFERLLAQKSPIVEVDGEWLALQPADVRAAQAVFSKTEEHLNLTVEDALRLSTGDTKAIAKLPVVSFETSGVLEQLINNLNNNQAVQLIDPPDAFKGQLRPYQVRGISWLAFLEQWSLGACLADDMGLGKTPQLIAFLLHLKAQNALNKPTLVVCPTSVLNNWEREVQKFAPTLSSLIHHGDRRSKGKDFAKEIKQTDLVITSYALVFRDLTTLEAIDWQGVVLDEAQNIKNPQAKQSQAVRKLKAGFRIALTGTPVENRLGELWSILDFLNPNFLGNRQFFQRRFAIPIEKYGDRDSLQTLRSLVQPFILRRLKTDKDIIQDLPEKQEMNVYCGLSAEQAQIYQELVDQSLENIEAAAGIKRRGLILTLLMQLKQVCNHPSHFLKQPSLDSSERSGKLLRLEEMLEESIEEGDRILIFTQFAEWGKLLQPYLAEKLERETLFLYGSTPRNQRQEMVDRFQNDPDGPPIFILSLKAGGTGLNLTRANHVFHIDRWWNPAVENQATDRAFRIGQKRNVQVHKFICTGTLEERINDMIESKKQLAEQTVDAGEDWLTELDTDQLRNLLFLDRNAIMDD